MAQDSGQSVKALSEGLDAEGWVTFTVVRHGGWVFTTQKNNGSTRTLTRKDGR